MRRRLIPVLLLDGRRRLVKTVGFGERTYIGDPFNVVRLFNEREVDEICLLGIEATAGGAGPDMEFLRKFASECFMPLAYGGGISGIEHCRELNRIGIEKFVLGDRVLDSALVRAIADEFGSQALVGCVDYAGQGAEARHRSGLTLDEALGRIVAAGVGEVILQSIDRDGRRDGYDLETIAIASRAIPVPLIALGGAGERSHFRPALEAGASAVASGSAFSFIGPLRAVLVNYPSPDEHRALSEGF